MGNITNHYRTEAQNLDDISYRPVDSDCVLTDRLCCREGTTSFSFGAISTASVTEFEGYREKECFQEGGQFYGEEQVCRPIVPDCPLPGVKCTDGKCDLDGYPSYFDCASKATDGGSTGDSGGSE